MRRIVTVMVLAAALGLAACASKPVKPASSQTATAGSGAASQGAGSGANAGEGSLGNQSSVPGPQQGLLADRTIHFAFNSAVIRGHGIEVVAAHAKYLADHANARVRLEGNTDDRGSPEYNIGLGMRRAESVRQAMLLQGVSPNQITVVSYGEERPVDPANTPSAWAKNRRVDIVYLTPTQPGH
ncbi:MAG: peptidoglycan-associated lipoprotein Pal [Pseudomonadota bacterium]|jgi:peptidoglycan-associated lipoprotein|nr:peptidoglycan-associated lipoprotein Pal [Pseudomonadota bacterium]